MTTLATYTFPIGSVLSGMAVRCYATGRYLNNSGGTLAPIITTTINNAAQCRLAPSVNNGTIALGWRLWAYFYLSPAVAQNGTASGIGSNLEFLFTTPQASAVRTGTFVGTQLFQITSNPYSTAAAPSSALPLSVVFTPAGGDALEVHCAIMEAL